MDVSPAPATPSGPLPARLRRVLDPLAGGPWRSRAFWGTQLLLLTTLGVHFAASSLYRHGLTQVPPFATLILVIVPVGYGAFRFGLRGSLPTALWSVVLLLPQLVSEVGILRWGDATMLALLIGIAAAAGRMVDLQRASTARLVESARLRGIARVADQLPDGLCLTDRAGIITYVNPAWADLQGLSSGADAVGRRLASLHPHEDAHQGSLPYQIAVNSERRQRAVVAHQLPNGRRYWADVTATSLRDEQGEVIGRLSTVRDVTADRNAAATLKEAEERFRLTFEQAPLGMATVTPEGRFLQVNDALCRMLGRSAAEMLTLGVLGITAPASRDEAHEMLRQRREDEQFVQRYVHKDGHLVSVQVTASLIHDPEGKPLYYIAQCQDVTEEHRHRHRLTEQAFHDALTGLPNRLLLEDRLAQALTRTHRQRHRIAVLFCDLDGFKGVNDRLGHQVGDEILRTVAARLQGCIRDVDTVARMGGDEFVVLLDGLTHSGQATDVAARIRDAIGNPYWVGEEEVSVGVSLGIALSSGSSSAAGTLLRAADAAMYGAKMAGGNGFQVAASKAAVQGPGGVVRSVSARGTAGPAGGRQDPARPLPPKLDMASAPSPTESAGARPRAARPRAGKSPSAAALKEM